LGEGPQQVSGLYGVSASIDKNFVLLYDNGEGAGRPLAATVVETSGVEMTESYPPFYIEQVIERSGHWGTMIPNGLAGGVQRVEERDLQTGEIVSVFSSPGGILPTMNLHQGLAGVGLCVPDKNASFFSIWQARNFSLAQLADDAVSGPMADADGDGLPNLIQCALGLNLFQPVEHGWPSVGLVESNHTQYLTFHYRRLSGDNRVNYLIEKSTDLETWVNASDGLIETEPPQPTGDGLTVSVTQFLPVEPDSGRCFLRLRIHLTPEP